MLDAKAQVAPERVIFVRVGGFDGRLYLDLCDKTWRAVEITSTGWRIVDEPPVRFKRAKGMLALPAPATGGSIAALQPFLNLRTLTEDELADLDGRDPPPDPNFVLAVAWLLAAFRDKGPYPVLALAGEHGAAKTTFCRVLRAFVDPNVAPLRALPREERDLFVAATNGHLVAFDNVSGLPAWLSDALCRVATGGGFAARELYSNQEETLLDAVRPVILNGIADTVTRPDLADRSLFLMLERIAGRDRKAEAAFWVAFETERPRILGALLTAVAEGLKRIGAIKLEELPRMADFALWVSACETAFWDEGTFAKAYKTNRREAIDTVIDADAVATAVLKMMDESKKAQWDGTASELLSLLSGVAGDRLANSKPWPKTPRALSAQLRRVAAALRKVGIDVIFGREAHTRVRQITITSLPEGLLADEEG